MMRLRAKGEKEDGERKEALTSATERGAGEGMRDISQMEMGSVPWSGSISSCFPGQTLTNCDGSDLSRVQFDLPQH